MPEEKKGLFNLFILLLFFEWIIPVNMMAQSEKYYEFIDNLYQYTVPIIKADSIINIDNYIVLDAREKREFDVSHLPGAIWVGYEDFSLDKVDNISHSSPILIYCSVGYRSERIGEQLQEEGFSQVKNLYGGIFDWINLRLPVEGLDGAPTDSIHAYNKEWGFWLEQGIKVYQ